MNQRGVTELTILFLLELILAVTAYGLLQEPLGRIAQDTSAKRQYLATDVGLTLTALQSSTANIVTVYDSIGLGDYSYSIIDGRLNALLKGATPLITVYARDKQIPFLLSEKPQVPLTIETPSKLYLAKAGGQVIIGDTLANAMDSRYLRSCGDAKPTFTGITLMGLQQMGDAFIFGYGTSAHRAQHANVNEASLTFTHTDSDTLTFYLNARSPSYTEAYALACHMGNAALAQNPKLKIALVPVDMQEEPALDLVPVSVLVLLPSAYQTHEVGVALATGARTWQEA